MVTLTRASYCMCLNPCFNGRYSQSSFIWINELSSLSLNPCFNGRYSQSRKYKENNKFSCVLILVLMEDTLRALIKLIILIIFRLNPCFNGRYSQSRRQIPELRIRFRLNPCFNGRYSQSKE